ncbi:MAG TPA: MBL fold metallo-hydrolase [Mycobacteriales bacterium]|nr:MBL fold metallo-hydrolase [Mycobacteriales bacterium]
MSVQIVPLDSKNLGNRSYLAHDGALAVAVDVPRDVDRMIELAAVHSVRIDLVVDTHGHGDWLTGGPELARLVGARYAAPAEIGGAHRETLVMDGTRLTVGALELRARHSPGHTPGHISYELLENDQTVGVFTGGSMLHGAVGRPDLNGAEHTEALAHAQYVSVRTLAEQLPAEAHVLPMHGFGSFCSATPTSGDSSRIDDERRVNPALTQSEGSFVAELLAGLDAYPAYYARMAPANAAGPDPVDLSRPPAVGRAEIHRRISAGEWVVDLRNRELFAAAHLAGTYNFDGAENAVTYLGWLMPAGAALTLLGESVEQVARVQRELALIGVDRPRGMAAGRVEDWVDGSELRSYRRVRFTDLATQVGTHPRTSVLDVRRTLEWRTSHLAGATHIPLHELPGRLDEVPDGELWVHCGSGFRASIAASILDRTGRHTVVAVDDDFANAEPAGCRIVRPQSVPVA